MPTGYYRAPIGLLSTQDEDLNLNEAASRAAYNPNPVNSGPAQAWVGNIGGTRMYLAGLSPDATQEEAEEYYRNSRAYQTSAGQGFLAPETWQHLNPDATASERKAYKDVYNARQDLVNFDGTATLTKSMGGPLGVIGAGILLAAGGAAAAGALGGGGAGAAGAAGGGAGTAGGAAAGTAGAAGAGTAGAAGGALGASAIPEIVVTGSAGGGLGTAAGAAGAAGGFYGAMDAAASNTSAINASNEQYLNSLEAPTANYGIDWMDLAKRVGGALSQGQGQQPMPMMGGGMPGLLGGGGGMAQGVATPRTVVRRSPLEQYMALSRLSLLGED